MNVKELTTEEKIADELELIRKALQEHNSIQRKKLRCMEK